MMMMMMMVKKNKSWPTWPHQQPRCCGKLRPFTNFFLFLLLFLLSFNPCLEVATRGMSLLWACKLPNKTPKLASQLGYPEIFNFQGKMHWLTVNIKNLPRPDPLFPPSSQPLLRAWPGTHPCELCGGRSETESMQIYTILKWYNGSGGSDLDAIALPYPQKNENISSEVEDISRTSSVSNSCSPCNDLWFQGINNLSTFNFCMGGCLWQPTWWMSKTLQEVPCEKKNPSCMCLHPRLLH